MSSVLSSKSGKRKGNSKSVLKYFKVKIKFDDTTYKHKKELILWCDHPLDVHELYYQFNQSAKVFDVFKRCNGRWDLCNDELFGALKDVPKN